MIDRLNGRLALLLAAVVVLLIVLVGWYMAVSPQRSKAATLDGQIGDAQVKLAVTQTFLRSGTGRRSVVQLRRLRVAIPDDVAMSDILRQLSYASARTGVRINGITPSAPIPTSGGQAIPISLTIEGHYFAIGKFMHLLRSFAHVSGGKVHASGRLFAVDSMSLASGGKHGALNATLALNAFVYGTPAVSAATDSAAGTSTTSTDQTTTTAP